MIFDGHSDIFSDVTLRRLKGEKNILKSHHLDRLREGQIEGGIFVMWIDPPYTKEPWERSEQIKSCIKEEMSESEDFVIVHNYDEIIKAKEEGKFYIVIGIEGLSPIGKDYEKIHEYYEFGARHAMLTWNEQNLLATGIVGDPDRGLTKEGFEAVKVINKLHMLMDVSHLNEKSFWDVMKVAEGPVVASHSNAKALSKALRNLTDEQLVEIKNTGGLVGINSFNLFVSQNPEEQTVENLVKHIIYICDKIGVEHVGFGFDFFEFLSDISISSFSSQETPYIKGLENCRKAPELLKLMKENGFTDDEIEMISYKNWHRVIKQVIG